MSTTLRSSRIWWTPSDRSSVLESWPRKRPEKLHADKAYDFGRCRGVLRRRGIKSRIARKGKDTSERLGKHRWVVERTLAWLARYRRLLVRHERRGDIHEAFLYLGCALVCLCYAKVRSQNAEQPATKLATPE